jgi:hypothetical protein
LQRLPEVLFQSDIPVVGKSPTHSESSRAIGNSNFGNAGRVTGNPDLPRRRHPNFRVADDTVRMPLCLVSAGEPDKARIRVAGVPAHVPTPGRSLRSLPESLAPEPELLRISAALPVALGCTFAFDVLFSFLHLFFPRFAAGVAVEVLLAPWRGVSGRMMVVVGREVTEFPLPEAKC